MEGVVRIVHDREHDQLQLLGSTRWCRRLPGLQQSINKLNTCIEAVRSDSDVVLAYAFSNIRANECYQGSSRASERTLLVYPLYHSTVAYELKQGNYFASMNGDPVIISFGQRSLHDCAVLCNKNPFLHAKYRPHPLEILLSTQVPHRPKNWRMPAYDR